MFANHPTIVTLHANSFCKYLKLLVQILLIRLCLQCITGTVRLAPMRSKSRWLCRFPVYQHVITFTKNQPGVPTDRPRGLRKSRDLNSPTMRFNPKLSHHLEISPCCAVFSLRCSLVPYMWASMTFLPYMWATMTFWPISLMDPNVLRECAQRLVEMVILSETQTELPNKLLT